MSSADAMPRSRLGRPLRRRSRPGAHGFPPTGSRIMPPAEPERRWLTGALSGTPIADEYRFIDAALRPCEPLAHAFDPSHHSTEVIEKARRWVARGHAKRIRVGVCSSCRPGDLAAPDRPVPSMFRRWFCAWPKTSFVTRGICARNRRGDGRRRQPRSPRGRFRVRCLILTAVPTRVSAARGHLSALASASSSTSRGCSRAWARSATPSFATRSACCLPTNGCTPSSGSTMLESRRPWLDAHPMIGVHSLGRFLRYAFATLEERMGAVPIDACPRTEAELGRAS